MHCTPILLAPLAILLACAPEHPREAAAPVWHAELLATVGADSGESAFASVRSLIFAPSGELLVADQTEQQVKVFASTGQFLRRFGRSGIGPGEYREPYSFAWLNDTLAILDPRNSRIVLFDPTGAGLGSFLVQPITGGPTVRLYRTPGAAFWTYGYKVLDGKPQNVFIRYTSAGPQDTLPYFRRPPTGTAMIVCEYPDKSLRFFEAPFAPVDLQIPDPTGRRAIARTDLYRIDFLGAGGDTLATIARELPGEAISDSEWESGLQDWRTMRTETPTAKCDADGFDRPAAKPVLAALFYDPQGRLWVEVRTPAGPRYDVYAPDGTMVASVEGLPSSGEVDPAFVGDRIAIVLPNDDGFPRIGIYQAVTERKER